MSSMNKVILIGHAGREPEARHTAQGTTIANLSLATTETWTKDGERNESTEWHRLVFFGRVAEIVEKYVAKGSLIAVEGKLKTRKWTDKDGVDRYTTEVHCHDLRLLSSRRDDFSQGGRAERAERPAQRQPQQRRSADEFDDSEIPF